jgi:dTDP-glucose 4,6-dehydratase
VVVTRASNNYGPHQFPEKIIPLFVTNALDGRRVPLYGDGLNVRDWLHVEDHCRAIDLLIDRGESGATYNIGGGEEVTNLDLTHRILTLTGQSESLIERVADRPGHDRRYALDVSKLAALGWRPEVPFAQGLADAVDWYRTHEWWWRPIKDDDPAFRAYYAAQYEGRTRPGDGR